MITRILLRQTSILYTGLLVGFWSLVSARPKHNDPIRLSETYELANIILALTDYGKTDPWEVSQQSAYYREVSAYFDPYAHHPLLATVNYSRKKWESYLSFRTDAYAFDFDKNNHLVRTVNFQANKGFNPFDENLSLIEDFVRVSNFRRFYQDHLPYYQQLSAAYLQSQRYEEMLHFLEKELGKRGELTNYAIVLSPLVGRMNCHRTVAGVGTDFITLPTFLLDGKAVSKATPEEIASGTHMLFTELDHAFVNPLTDQYQTLVKANFTVAQWDEGSGYDKDSLSTFNEYMTWGLFDLYVQQYFPDVATNVSNAWALQNATRGFFASSLFNQELARIYKARRPNQTVKDLYPAFIKRIGVVQQTLSKPLIIACNLDNQTLTDTVATVVIRFSEPMQPLHTLDVVRVVEQAGKVKQERLELTPGTSALTWTDRGTTLRFRLSLIKGSSNQLLFNYPWKTRIPLRSYRNVDLKPYSSFKTKVLADKSSD